MAGKAAGVEVTTVAAADDEQEASRVGGAQEEQCEAVVQWMVVARSHQAVSEAMAAAKRTAAMGVATEVMPVDA